MFKTAGLLVCLLCLCWRGAAQSWPETYAAAQAEFKNDNAEEALALATRALRQYQEEDGATTPSYAAILRLLSEVCYRLSRYEEGLGYVEKELVVLSARDETHATACVNASLFHRELGRFAEAIAMLRQAGDVLQTFYPPDAPPVVAVQLQLAINHYLAGQGQQAMALFSAHLDADPGEDNLLAHYYFSRLLLSQGRAAAAFESLERTKRAFEKFGLSQSAAYAAVLTSLGEALHQSDQPRQAEALYRLAGAILENAGEAGSDEFAELASQRIVNYYALNAADSARLLLQKLAARPADYLAYTRALTRSASWLAAHDQPAAGRGQAMEAVTRLASEQTPQGKSALVEAMQALAYIEALVRDTTAGSTSARALALAHELSDGQPTERLAAQNQHTRNLLLLGAHAAALRSARTAATMLRRHDGAGPAAAIECLTLLGRAGHQAGDFLLADSAYATALHLYETDALPANRQYTALVGHFSHLQQERGNWARARELLLLNAAGLEKQAGPPFPEYPTALENLALLELRLGRTREAKQYLDAAWPHFSTDERKKTKAFGAFQLTMGKYFQATADFAKAEVWFRGAQAILMQAAGPESEACAQAQNALALLYQTLGNYAEAEPRLKEAAALFESRGNWRELSTAKQNLATLYQIQEKFDAAEILLTEARVLDEKYLGPQHPQYIVTLQNLAALYQKKKDTDKAAALLEDVRATAVRTLGQNHPLYATIHANLAALCQDRGEYEKSEKYWSESIATRKHLLGEEHPDYVRSVFGLANLYFATGRFAEAEPRFEAVVLNYQSQVTRYFAAMSEKEKSALYARMKPVFDTYQDFCVQFIQNGGPRQQLTERLYNLQLFNKAILLNASNRLRTAIAGSTDEELKRLFREWIATKEQIVKHYNLTRQEREASNINVAATEARANDLEKALSQKSAVFGSLGAPQAARWQQIQAGLEDDEAAIETMRIRKKFVPDSIYYVALVVSKRLAEPRLFIWPRGAQLENRFYRYHRNTIKHQITDTLSHGVYWQPLAAALPPVKKLWISSDGIFNKINLNTLFNPATQRWIIDDYTIRLINNTRELADRQNKPGNPFQKTAALFGYADFNKQGAVPAAAGALRSSALRFGFEEDNIPMLPATEKEIQNISALLAGHQWQTRTFMLEQASEQNLKSIEGPGILHVATHGFFLKDVELAEDADTEEAYRQNPLFRSGILLAGAALKAQNNDEDGVLTAYEALNLNLDRTELVSLSACETGLGEVRNGEGVYGLQRAFLVAGARSVLMSLWQVDDEATQELMEQFYQAWFAGQSKTEAFREAQIRLKEKYAQPFFWGAFVLIGD
jgi:CHAT domain-containing protein